MIALYLANDSIAVAPIMAAYAGEIFARFGAIGSDREACIVCVLANVRQMKTLHRTDELLLAA